MRFALEQLIGVLFVQSFYFLHTYFFQTIPSIFEIDSVFQEADFMLSISTQGGIPVSYSEPALVQQVQQPFEPFFFVSQVFRGFLHDFGDEPQNTDQVEQQRNRDDLQYDSPFLNAIIEKEEL